MFLRLCRHSINHLGAVYKGRPPLGGRRFEIVDENKHGEGGFRFFVRNPSKYLQRKCGTSEFRRFEIEFWHFEIKVRDFEKEFGHFQIKFLPFLGQFGPNQLCS